MASFAKKPGASQLSTSWYSFQCEHACRVPTGLAVLEVWDRNKNTPDDYFLASRKLRILPVAFSFIATFQSSLLILGTPVETYLYGTVFCYYAIGISLSYIFAGVTAVPVFYTLELTSVYRYFEIRYQDRLVKNMVMGGAVVHTVFYVATVTYGTCVALELVMGVPYWATILLYSTVTVVYTSVGGIKAVIWTDVFQILVMVTAVIAVHTKTALDTGGSARIVHLSANRFNMDDFGFDITKRYTMWNVCFGSFVRFLYCAYSQAGIQRINTTSSVNAGRWMYIISGPMFALIVLVIASQGVSVFAYYSSKGCDVLSSKTVGNVNGLMPFAILDLFQDFPGMSGLFVASLSSAVLSTLSSFLNSLSAITYDDVIKVVSPSISDKKATLMSKIAVLAYGLVGMALTFVVSKIPGGVVVIFMALMGCMEGPTVAIFILSTMFKRSTTPGMIVGGFAGVGVTLWMSLGRMMTTIPPDAVLPAGPTDGCSAYTTMTTVSTLYAATTNVSLASVASWSNTTYSVAAAVATVAPGLTEGSVSVAGLTPLQRFYSVSPMVYSVVGMVTTVIVGVLASVLTKPPPIIDNRCLFSFSTDSRHRDDSSNSGTEEEREMMQVMAANV